MLSILNIAFEGCCEDQIYGMWCPQGRPYSGPVGVFELPAVKRLAIVPVIVIGVYGSLRKEVIKHFHDSGPLSIVRRQTTLSDMIFFAVLGLGCNLTQLELKCMHFLQLEFDWCLWSRAQNCGISV